MSLMNTTSKSIVQVIIGDFNVDLLKYDQHPPANEFLVSLSFYMLLLHTVQAGRRTNNSKTLIDNIYSNAITPNNVLGNFIAPTSNHPFSFLLLQSTIYKIFLKEIALRLIKKTLLLTTELQIERI